MWDWATKFTNAMKQITHITDVKSVTEITQLGSKITDAGKTIATGVTSVGKVVATGVTSVGKDVATGVTSAGKTIASGVVMVTDDIKYDTVPTLNQAAAVVGNTLMLKVADPIIKPFSKIVDMVKAMIAPAQGPDYHCKISGGGPGVYNNTPQAMHVFNLSATIVGMTAFTQAVERQGYCGNKNLSDSEAAFFTAVFDSMLILPPDNGGCMSAADEAQYLYTMCSMSATTRKSFIQYATIFPNCSQSEINEITIQDAALTEGISPISCAKPPQPPIPVNLTIAMMQSCTVLGGGQGVNNTLVKGYTKLFSQGSSPFYTMMVRSLLCSEKAFTDSQATSINNAMNSANIIKLETGCTVASEWPTLDHMLAAECVGQRSSFVSLMSNFPGSTPAEVSHFNATIATLGCYQSAACPTPTIVCRTKPHADAQQTPNAKAFPTDQQIQSCLLTGSGAGVLSATQLASFSLPVGMSAFRLMVTREAFCQQAGWSDVEVATLTRILNSYQPVNPLGRAMTDADQTTFDGMLQNYCVDARQGFYNALKTWPTASSDELSHFNILVQSLGSSQPKYCPAPGGPIATTPIISSANVASQITTQTVLDQANCTITGGGQAVLNNATIAKFQTAFAVTMSKFHQAILRSQLCTLKGLTDAGALQLTQMVERISTVTPSTGALTPDETTSFLSQLQTWCLPARQIFVAQLVAWPTTSSAEKSKFMDAQTQLGDSQPAACAAAAATGTTSAPPTISRPPRPTLTYTPPTIHRGSPNLAPTPDALPTTPAIIPPVLKRPASKSSKAQSNSVSAPDSPKTVSEATTKQAPCQLQGGGTGHFSKKSMAVLKAGLVDGKSPFGMIFLRHQLCSLSNMSDSEVERVEKMLAAAPILTPTSGAMTSAEKKAFLSQLPSWCIEDRQDFLMELTSWPTASKTEIGSFTKAMKKLGTQQPTKCVAGGIQSTSVALAVQPLIVPATIHRPSHTSTQTSEGQAAPADMSSTEMAVRNQVSIN
ncbi:hypothetical protein FRB98_004775 [Tulasnella sp. 332]|nr:hypothetical protein FRB98_004775 [Tulasnella sp. 332]